MVNMKRGSAFCSTAISLAEETARSAVSGISIFRAPVLFRSVEKISTGAPSQEAA
jgi:hypothetical protein